MNPESEPKPRKSTPKQENTPSEKTAKKSKPSSSSKPEETDPETPGKSTKHTIHSESERSSDTDTSSLSDFLEFLEPDEEDDRLEAEPDPLHCIPSKELSKNEAAQAKFRETGFSTQGQQRFALCIESLERRLSKKSQPQAQA